MPAGFPDLSAPAPCALADGSVAVVGGSSADRMTHGRLWIHALRLVALLLGVFALRRSPRLAILGAVSGGILALLAAFAMYASAMSVVSRMLH